MKLKDNEYIKVQGICGGGFWLRYVRNNKIYAEEFIHANCISLGLIYFQNKIEDLVNEGRIRTDKSDKFEGSLIAYKNIDGMPKGFPIFHLETFIEHFYPEDGDIEPDEATKLIYSAQNKLQAISALFQSVMSDLEQLSDVHFDDNGKELALAVSRQIEKITDNFEEKVHEPCGDWTNESLSGVLYKLTRDHHQVLVVPEFRRTLIEDLARDETKETQDADTELWLSAVRQQFDLSEKWR